MCQRDLHFPRGMWLLQVFWSRWDTSLPSQLTSEHRHISSCTDSLDNHITASVGATKQQQKGFERQWQRGATPGGGTRAFGQALFQDTQTGASIFKIRGGKKPSKSSFQLQIGQSNYIPPLSILPMPAAGATGTTGSGGLQAVAPKAHQIITQVL